LAKEARAKKRAEEKGEKLPLENQLRRKKEKKSLSVVLEDVSG